MIEGDFFIPEADIVVVLADGRHIFLEPKGKRIPLHIAREKGYVKDELTVGPSEFKAADVQPEVSRTHEMTKADKRKSKRK